MCEADVLSPLRATVAAVRFGLGCACHGATLGSVSLAHECGGRTAEEESLLTGGVVCAATVERHCCFPGAAFSGDH